MLANYLKTLLTFSTTPISDTIEDVLFNPIGDEDISLNSLGYQMSQTQYLVGENVVTDFSVNGFSVGFWLNSVNPGIVRNPQTLELEPLRMPILSFWRVSASIVPFSIYELTNDDGTNYLEIQIYDVDEGGGEYGGGYTVYSDSYEAGLSHYIFITVSVEKEQINIYIDGKESAQNSAGGDFPTTFNLYSTDVYINKITETSYDYNLMNNYGSIGELAIFNIELNPNIVLPKIINYGAEEFADLKIESNFIKNEESYVGVLFDDPATLKVNAMVDDMSYVYLARNDGRILRGSPLFWESRRVFSEETDSLLNDSLVEKSGGGESTPAEIINGFLRIKNSIVRL